MRTRRRGTIYLLTLATTLIAATLGAAAILAVRSQRRQTDFSADILQANANALSGLEIVLFRIANNSTWRTQLMNDTWSDAVTLRDGTYFFVGTDPDDGDLTDDDFDPVLITATGTCGTATQNVSARLEMRNAGLRCLEPVIHSKGNLVFSSTTVTGNRLVSSNARVSAASASEIYVEAQSKLTPTASSDSTFHAGTSTDGVWPREMPVASDALEYYETNGTPIDAADLPQWDAEQLTNPGIASATTGWEAVDTCSLTLDTEASQTAWSILVDGRSGPGDGPSQLVTERIQSGGSYAVAADAKCLSGTMSLRISLKLTSTGDGVQTFSTDWTTADDTAFATVAGTLTPSWTGTLSEARWFVESESSSSPFWFDDASLTDANAQAGFLAIHRAVLSPSCNPFGSSTTNAQGIYVIDCGGSPISIKDSRIVGTLLLVNFDDTQSFIHGSMSWEPSVASADPNVTNLPILLTDGSFLFDTSEADLDEGLLNVNLNPEGTAYEEVEDEDKDDAIPSLLGGMIYINGALDVTSSLRLHGVLVVTGVATFTGADVIANYDPLYYWYNAPPGFEGDPAVDVAPGTLRRVVE